MGFTDRGMKNIGLVAMVLLVVVSAPLMAFFMYEGNPFAGGFEVMHTQWVSYDSPQYGLTNSPPTPKQLSGKNVRIDVDGTAGGTVFVHDRVTAIEAKMGVPVAVNYQNGRYSRVSWDNWTPETEWEIGGRGVSVYRMMFGVTIKTVGSNAKETDPLEITLRGEYDLNTWDAVPDTLVGMGYMEIPTEEEYKDSLVVDAIDVEDGFLGKVDDLFARDANAEVDPPNAGEALNMYYVDTGSYGGNGLLGGSVDNIPSKVEFDIHIAKIKAGSVDKLIGEDTRVEIEIRMRIAVVLMSSRPLYSPTGDPTIDKNKGGKLMGKSTLFDMWGDLKGWAKTLAIMFGIMVFVVVMLVIVFLGSKIGAIFSGPRY